MVASANGLGASLDSVPSEQRELLQSVSVRSSGGMGLPLLITDLQTYYTSNIFYLLSLDASKVASILFVYRLTSRSTNIRRYSGLVATVLPISTVVFVIATALQCRLSQPWVFIGQKCPGWVS